MKLVSVMVAIPLVFCACQRNRRTSAETTGDGNVGAACVSHTDCVTPASFLLRNVCPYSSRCIDNRCAVVCPVPAPGRAGWQKPVGCRRDADCDCKAYAPSNLQSCRCIEQACVVVVQAP